MMARQRKDLEPGQRVVVTHSDPRWNGLRGSVLGRERDDPTGMIVLRIDGKSDPHWFDDWDVELEQVQPDPDPARENERNE